jgi:3-hydroxyisobutyrate dehydrogenase
VILDIVNASSGRNSATEDKFLNRILHGRYDAGFTAKLQLKDIRLYLEAARAAGITDDVAGPVVDLWQRMEAAMPGADITDMYRYTQKRRRS